MGVTLLFFMVLIGTGVPPGTRLQQLIVVSLGLAIGSAFLGGAAAIRGNLPIPGAQSHPLAFSVAGGVAVFLIVMLIGHFVFPDGEPPYKPVEEIAAGPTTGPDGMKIELVSELEAHKDREGAIMTLRRVLKAMSADAEKETDGVKESRVYAYSSQPFRKAAVPFLAEAELGAGVKYECIEANAYVRHAGSAEVVHHDVSQNNALLVSVPAAEADSRLTVLIRLCGAKGKLPAPETIRWKVDQ